jgi:hypothetical protein
MDAPHRVGKIPRLDNEYSRKKRPMRPWGVPLPTTGPGIYISCRDVRRSADVAG